MLSMPYVRLLSYIQFIFRYLQEILATATKDDVASLLSYLCGIIPQRKVKKKKVPLIELHGEPRCLIAFWLTNSKGTVSARFILLLVFYIEFGLMACGGSSILMGSSFVQLLLSKPLPVWIPLEDLSKTEGSLSR